MNMADLMKMEGFGSEDSPAQLGDTPRGEYSVGGAYEVRNKLCDHLENGLEIEMAVQRPPDKNSITVL